MIILENIFGKKKSIDIFSFVVQEVDKIFFVLLKRRFRFSEDIYSLYVVDFNFFIFFNIVGEIFFFIDFFVSCIVGGRFMFKKVFDDLVVWNNKQFNDLIDCFNCLNLF